MNTELKELFERALYEGINIFTGAGFSIYASDNDGKLLPTASMLCEELSEHFDTHNLNDLSKICTIIDSFNSDGLKKYLINRFTVKEFPSFYKNLVKINCPRIFTTNIDNLINRIYDTNPQKYINNIYLNGLCFKDKNCIDYIPLHGSIEVEDSKFLFNIQEVSTSFSTKRSTWTGLRLAVNQLPSLFIGYSLNDVGAIESLFGDEEFISNQKTKWIVLYKPNDGEIDYFKALGFKIIEADTKELLEYFGTLDLSSEELTSSSKDYMHKLYPEACIPKGTQNTTIRSIDEFFLGAAPIWSDIISNRIYKTSHFDEITNLIEQPKHLIVTGIPASGKSTLLLQIAKHINSYHRAFVFNGILTINKSNIINYEIKTPTVLFIDNFTSDIDAFLALTKNPNIKLVGFDRYYNIDISSHKLPKTLFEYYDATDLTPADIQGIYDKIPLTLRKSPLTTQNIPSDIPSIFEIVNYNINRTEITRRYKPVINEIKENNPILLELLILSCYLHACRTPVSFEVANSYLSDVVESYEEVFQYLESLKGLVNEVVGSIFDEYSDQDYYQPRSQILAETIIEQITNSDFSIVFKKFHENVPQHLIPNYHVFKRSAYDSFYAKKAFSRWEEGLKFYDDVFSRDRNPFVLQQAALYLLNKRKYTEAALKIDYALQISRKRFFSIENSHAIILFKANINSNDQEADKRKILDRSMGILKSCYLDDQRKTYHAVTFAQQALEYYAHYTDSVAKEYLVLAKTWLKEIETGRKHNIRVRSLLKELEQII